MSVDQLPNEILRKIFQKLHGRDVLVCSKVSRRWKEIADSFTDEVWKEFCKHEFSIRCLDQFSKSILTWREFYKSLTLWPVLHEAKMTVRELPAYKIHQFQILPNGTIAIIQNNSNDSLSNFCGLGDTIVYYNMDTLEEIGRDKFGFLFESYKENDNFIAMVDRDTRLCVFPKINKKLHIVGELDGEWGVLRYEMFQNEIYFHNNDGIVYVSKLKKRKNDEWKIKTEPLAAFEYMDRFEENIVGFGYAGDGEVYILTDEGNIYHHKKGFSGASKIDRYMCINEILYELRDFGFDWTSPNIYAWLASNFKKEMMQISPKFKNVNIHTHLNVMLVGRSSHRKMYIYYDPYTRLGTTDLHHAVPIKALHLDKIVKHASAHEDAIQLDAIEIINGHRVIVMMGNALTFIDFKHELKED